jgi:hypothetical protein
MGADCSFNFLLTPEWREMGRLALTDIWTWEVGEEDVCSHSSANCREKAG